MTQHATVEEPVPATFWTFDGNTEITRSFRGEFAGIRDNLRDIRQLAATAAAATGMDEIEIAQFEMAVDEICANVVEHAYEKHGGGTLRLEIALFGDRIEGIVTDRSAVRFAATQTARHDLASFYEGERRRGLGLDIVRHSVDRVEHQWLQPLGNQTRLIKYFDKSR